MQSVAAEQTVADSCGAITKADDKLVCRDLKLLKVFSQFDRTHRQRMGQGALQIRTAQSNRRRFALRELSRVEEPATRIEPAHLLDHAGMLHYVVAKTQP